MKLKNYSLLVLFLFVNINLGYSWATDVEVSSVAPQGASSVVSNAAGILYASVPQNSLNPSYALSIYESTDNGATWTQLNLGGGSPGQVVTKSKMLVTGLNNIVCVYLLNDSIYVLDVSSGVSTLFPTSSARDFDVASSFSLNVIYLFVDELSSNDIRRYSSTDAGVTWTGSTALVSANAAHPRVYMSGTKLFLSYYGPVQADTANSVLRSTGYNESSPGTLVSGNFIDIVTGTSVPKHQFRHVGVNASVWFFWTEGTSPSVLKCKLSTDNGATFGTEFIVAGTATMQVGKFDAKHYSNTVSTGVQVAYYGDSIQVGAPDPNTERILFISADISNPQVFSSPQQVSDHTVDASLDAFEITLISYFYSFSGVAGVLWVEDAGSGLYYDASSSVVNGINDLHNQSFSLNVYPNPATQFITVDLQKNISGSTIVELTDVSGKLLFKTNEGVLATGNHTLTIDVSEFSQGIYYLRIQDEKQQLVKKIVRL